MMAARPPARGASTPPGAAASSRAESLELAEAVDVRFGLKLHAGLRTGLSRAARELLESGACADFRELLQRLRSGTEEDLVVRALRVAASVTETYFFRDGEQLAALVRLAETALFPAKRAAGSRRLRIWSAACATGEEPYTLAHLFREAAPDFDVQVTGTDMNEAALQVARAGVYGRKSLRKVRPERYPTLFQEAGPLWEVLPAVRKGVTFQVLNLVKGQFPSVALGLAHFDIVVCRNVLIYLDGKDLPELVKKLTRSLLPRSILALSPAEYSAGAFAPDYRHISNGILLRAPEPRTVASSASPTAEAPRPDAPAGVPRASSRVEELNFEATLAEVRATADAQGQGAAEQLLAKLMERHPDSPWLYLVRGQVLLALGDGLTAARSFRAALFLSPGLVAAELGLGQALLKERRHAEAEGHFQRVLRLVSPLGPEEPVPGLGMTAEAVLRLVQSTGAGETAS